MFKLWKHSLVFEKFSSKEGKERNYHEEKYEYINDFW